MSLLENDVESTMIDEKTHWYGVLRYPRILLFLSQYPAKCYQVKCSGQISNTLLLVSHSVFRRDRWQLRWI